MDRDTGLALPIHRYDECAQTLWQMMPDSDKETLSRAIKAVLRHDSDHAYQWTSLADLWGKLRMPERGRFAYLHPEHVHAAIVGQMESLPPRFDIERRFETNKARMSEVFYKARDTGKKKHRVRTSGELIDKELSRQMTNYLRHSRHYAVTGLDMLMLELQRQNAPIQITVERVLSIMHRDPIRFSVQLENNAVVVWSHSLQSSAKQSRPNQPLSTGFFNDLIHGNVGNARPSSSSSSWAGMAATGLCLLRQVCSWFKSTVRTFGLYLCVLTSMRYHSLRILYSWWMSLQTSPCHCVINPKP